MPGEWKKMHYNETFSHLRVYLLHFSVFYRKKEKRSKVRTVLPFLSFFAF